MAKYRASQDFAQTYAGNKNGFGVSIENYLHLKEETTAGTFVPPSVGTQGISTSAAAPSSDISASSNRNGRIAVDGGAVLAFGLSSVVGLDTGDEIATALETAINTALSTAGRDSRVWVEYSSSLYKVRSQKTGTTSAVVITNGLSLDLMTELKLGTGNTGVEAVGTAGGDFLYMTKASLKMSQPFEMSEHKSGRQASSIIKKKKVSEGELEMYFNAGSGGDPTVDTALALLLESAIGNRTDSTGEILFDGSQANSKYFSVLQGNNAFGRAFNGGYAKSFKISLPGDGEAKMSVPIKMRDAKYSGIAQLNGAIAASATAIVNNGESPNFDIGARVMVVKADGRTVVAGQDGSLTILTRTDGSHTLGLSATVTVDDDGFIVPWLPHCFDQVGTDNPVTGLEGTVSLDGGSTTIEQIRSVEFTYDPKVTDFDNWYGSDTNKGFVVGDRADIMVKIEFVLSATQIKQIVQAKEFTTAAVRVILGDSADRHFRFDCPNVYFEVPDTEIPDTGEVVMTLNGRCLQSAPGALDALQVRML